MSYLAYILFKLHIYCIGIEIYDFKDKNVKRGGGDQMSNLTNFLCPLPHLPPQPTGLTLFLR
jgi:hypothetical protein